MEMLNIILEYIKVLIWPFILVLAFVVYGDNLLRIMENREIDAFGLKIGKQIEDISNNYQAELASLKDKIKENQGDEALLETVQGIGVNLDRELSKVRTSALQQSAIPGISRREENVEALERKGFEAILNRDVTAAIDAFSEARDLWPDYHNVSEIRKLLLENRTELADSGNAKAWGEIASAIDTKYSWGISPDLREKLKKFGK